MARYLISEAARLTDVEAHVLRYWEEELELEIPRNELGHRYYTEEHIAIFNHIKEMKVQGFQLRAIKESLARVAAARRAEAGSVKAEGGYVPVMDDLETVYDLDEEEEEEEELYAPAAGESAAAYDFDSGGGYGPEDPYGPEAETAAAVQTEALEEIDTAPDEPMQSNEAALRRQNKMAEFESIVYDIVTEALRNNNERLGREVSDRVNDKVVKELNYLMRENEDRMEEHFRKLDDVLVRKGRKGRIKGEKEAAATCVPHSPALSQTKRKRRFFGRKRKTTIY